LFGFLAATSTAMGSGYSKILHIWTKQFMIGTLSTTDEDPGQSVLSELFPLDDAQQIEHG
jgi:hypothetical protein